jgi:hypothetical protein
MEKGIVHYIGFPVLAIHNPVALRGVARTGLGRDRLRSIALGRIYDERPKRSESIHMPSVGDHAPTSLLEDFFHKDYGLEALGFCKNHDRNTPDEQQAARRTGPRERHHFFKACAASW